MATALAIHIMLVKPFLQKWFLWLDIFIPVDFINGWQEGKLQPVLDNCGATCNSAFGDVCIMTLISGFLSLLEWVATMLCKYGILDHR